MLGLKLIHVSKRVYSKWENKSAWLVLKLYKHVLYITMGAKRHGCTCYGEPSMPIARFCLINPAIILDFIGPLTWIAREQCIAKSIFVLQNTLRIISKWNEAKKATHATKITVIGYLTGMWRTLPVSQYTMPSVGCCIAKEYPQTNPVARTKYALLI